MVQEQGTRSTAPGAGAQHRGGGRQAAEREPEPDTPADMRSTLELAAGVPAFLAKLWRLVEDTDTDHLISWHAEGKTFCIHNQAEFAKELLPLYYKHNNMASFIRQLNMYGFHKVSSVENGGLRADKDDIEFYHPFFLMGRPYLLEHIKRKIANPKVASAGDDKALLKPELMTKVLTDVKSMKGRQENLDAKFSVMKHENEALWREVALLRQKHIKQQQIVNNLIQFLMSLVQPSRNGPLKTGVKRRYQLMIDEAAHNSDEKLTSSAGKAPRINDLNLALDTEDFDLDDENGPTIHEVADPEHSTEYLKKKSRLLTDTESQYSASPSNPSPSFIQSPSSQGQENVDALLDDAEMLQTVPPSVIENLASNVLLDIPDKNGQNIQNTAEEPTNSQYSFVVPSQVSNELPDDIFEDEENSQIESVNEEDVITALQNAAQSSSIDSSELLSKLTSGAYNTELNTKLTSKSKSKSKKGKIDTREPQRNIKKEIITSDDENDSSNMTLATISTGKDGTRPAFERFNSVMFKNHSPHLFFDKDKKNLPGSASNEEVDDHLDTMQSDLENLKELLRGDSYSLDTNTLFGIFGQEDPFYNLSMNPSDLIPEKSKVPDETDPASQIISYQPQPTLDFDDFDLDDDERNWNDIDSVDKNVVDSALNTPQVQLNAPDFTAK